MCWLQTNKNARMKTICVTLVADISLLLVSDARLSNENVELQSIKHDNVLKSMISCEVAHDDNNHTTATDFYVALPSGTLLGMVKGSVNVNKDPLGKFHEEMLHHREWMISKY